MESGQTAREDRRIIERGQDAIPYAGRALNKMKTLRPRKGRAAERTGSTSGGRQYSASQRPASISSRAVR